ncbi:hypothetical protein EB796_006040 [Bugula neritina]|uniref:Uncharacterized protein n=1 Tax=Bugula neritina TaxID=10212 RepID=A0A7J7KBQ3_BUGNE|nr:hypothetical protein EB796_006040 [Bugula neritina]
MQILGYISPISFTFNIRKYVKEMFKTDKMEAQYVCKLLLYHNLRLQLFKLLQISHLKAALSSLHLAQVPGTIALL